MAPPNARPVLEQVYEETNVSKGNVSYTATGENSKSDPQKHRNESNLI